MMTANDVILKQGLEHTVPIYRFCAALAVGKRNKAQFKDNLIILCAGPTI